MHQHADERQIIRRGRINAAAAGETDCRVCLRLHRLRRERSVRLASMHAGLARSLLRRDDERGVVHAERVKNLLAKINV